MPSCQRTILCCQFGGPFHTIYLVEGLSHIFYLYSFPYRTISCCLVGGPFNAIYFEDHFTNILTETSNFN